MQVGHLAKAAGQFSEPLATSPGMICQRVAATQFFPFAECRHHTDGEGEAIELIADICFPFSLRFSVFFLLLSSTAIWPNFAGERSAGGREGRREMMR